MKIKIIKDASPSLLLLLLFLTEGYFKVVFFSTGESTGLLQATKGVLLLTLTIYLLIKQSKQIYLIGLLFIIFLIGQFALDNGFSVPVLIVFLKLIYPIILLLFFSAYKLTDRQKHLFFKAFEHILLFNSLIIIIGFLFDIKIFNTYLFEGRLAFNGLITTSATSSYVYSITLIYLLAKYNKSIFKKIQNLIIILSMFLIGTKAVYLFLICFFVIYAWNYLRINKITLIICVLTFLVLVVYIFFFKYGIFNEIRKENGLLASLMSYRNELFLGRTLPSIKESWSIVNYLFGGVSDLTTKAEMEFIDIFYFFGIIGGLFYYFLFFKVFLVFKANIIITILLSILFIIVLLGGNFFGYSSIAIYIVLLREYLKINE